MLVDSVTATVKLDTGMVSRCFGRKRDSLDIQQERASFMSLFQKSPTQANQCQYTESGGPINYLAIETYDCEGDARTHTQPSDLAGLGQARSHLHGRPANSAPAAPRYLCMSAANNPGAVIAVQFGIPALSLYPAMPSRVQTWGLISQGLLMLNGEYLG